MTKRKVVLSPRLTVGFLALGILVILIILGKLVSFINSFNLPYAPVPGSSGIEKSYSWEGTTPINFVYKSDQLSLVSYSPTNKTLVIVKVPGNARIKLPFGFGQWPARSIYELGQAEQPPMGPKILQETFSQMFGIPIDGYIIPTDDFPVEKAIEDMRKSWLFSFQFLRSVNTNFSLKELITLARGVEGVRFDKVKVVDLSESNISTVESLLDGSQATVIDPQKLDRLMSKQFEDDEISHSGLSVAVFNATNHPQLAERAARVVTNIGGRVIFTSNSTVTLNNNVVLGKDSYSKNRLIQIFGGGCQKTTGWPFGSLGKGDCGNISCEVTSKAESGVKLVNGCDLALFDQDPSRADVFVFLGEEYYDKYNAKN